MALSQRRGKLIESKSIPAIAADTYLVDLRDVLTVGSFSLAAYQEYLPLPRSEITFLRVEHTKEVPDKDFLVQNKKLAAWMAGMSGRPMWLAVDFKIDDNEGVFSDDVSEYIINLSRRIISNNGGGLVIIPGDKKKLSKVLTYILNQEFEVNVLEENSAFGYLIFDIPFKHE